MDAASRFCLLKLLLLLVLIHTCSFAEAAVKQAAVTVTTCTTLFNAIQNPSANPILIPAGTTIDVTTCPGSQLPAFNRPTLVQGTGYPLPIITGKNKTKIFTSTSYTGGPYLVTLKLLVLGNGISNVPNGENAGCFWVYDGSQCSIVVDTVTFANCTGNDGGAIFVHNAAATVRNCTFTNNLATGPGRVFGGALASYGSNQPLSITSSSFVGNRAVATPGGDAATGGAVWADGNINVSDSVFTNNIASSTENGAYGGAMHSDQAVTILRCAFTGNQARGLSNTDGAGGGAVDVYQGVISSSSFTLNLSNSTQQWSAGGALNLHAVVVTNCSFTNNTSVAAPNYDAAGGAVRIWTNGDSNPSPSNFTLTNFTSNLARGANTWGGAIASALTVNLANALLTSNAATSTLPQGSQNGGGANGGAIQAEGSVTASLCAFTGNTVTLAAGGGSGGAVQNPGQTTTLTSCTFTGNTIRSTSTSDGVLGGAVIADQIVVSFSAFTANSISSTRRFGYGGAVQATGSVYALNTSFTNNTVVAGGTDQGNGGAINIDVGGSSSCNANNFTFCSFSGNTVKGPNAYGGALVASCNTYIFGTSFVRNSASSTAGSTYKDSIGDAQGGAYNIWNNGQQQGTQTLVTGSTFIGNAVDGNRGVSGGAVYSQYDYIDTGGLYANNSASLRFAACSQNCPGTANAGAIWEEKGQLVMTGSTLRFNTATSAPSDGVGGAVALTQVNSPATFTSCTFVGNVASSGCSRGCDPGYGGGGAIWSNYALNVQSCGFSYNAAVSKGISNYATGGAVRAQSPQSVSPIFASSSFLGNYASSLASGQANGGAVSVQVSDSGQQGTITGCTFANNSASGLVAGGGAVSALQGFLSISSCSFSSNSASSSASQAFGGAVDTRSSSDPVTITSCSFASNLATSVVGSGGAASGGALYFGNSGSTINGYLSVLSSSFLRNSAVSDNSLGGAVVVGQGIDSLSGVFLACTFEGNSVVGSSSGGGAVAGLSNTLISFCRTNVFGKKVKNVAQAAVGGAAATNDLDGAGGIVKFCPSISVYNDVNSNFMALLDCSSCDCGLFNPCDVRASCQLTSSSVPYCQCPANTRGNGFTCGPVVLCA